MSSNYSELCDVHRCAAHITDELIHDYCNITDILLVFGENVTLADQAHQQEDMVAQVFSTILNGWMTSIVAWVGFILNVICIVVFTRPHIRNKSTRMPMINYYLLTIAVWDNLLLVPGAFLLYRLTLVMLVGCLLLLIIGGPTLYFGKLTVIGYGYSYVWPFVYYISITTLTGSVWVMMALSVDRYMALSQPLKHRRFSRRQVSAMLIAISVMASIYNIPEMFKLKPCHCRVPIVICATQPEYITHITQSSLAFSNSYHVWYRIVGGFLTYSLVPFAVFIVLTVAITVKLANAQETHAKLTNASLHPMQRHSINSVPRPSVAINLDASLVMTNNDGYQSSTYYCLPDQAKRTRRRQATLSNSMHAAVIMKFVCCRIMCACLDVLEKVAQDTFYTSPIVSNMVHLSNFLVVLNSASNFVVYLYFSHTFRETVKSYCICVYKWSSSANNSEHPEMLNFTNTFCENRPGTSEVSSTNRKYSLNVIRTNRVVRQRTPKSSKPDNCVPINSLTPERMHSPTSTSNRLMVPENSGRCIRSRSCNADMSADTCSVYLSTADPGDSICSESHPDISAHVPLATESVGSTSSLFSINSGKVSIKLKL